MKREFLQLEGITKTYRHLAIQKIKDAILSGGGFVTDFTMFSNKASCIKFEVSFGSLERLEESLVGTEMLTKESMTKLNELVILVADKNKDREILGTLNITFLHDEPDLRIEAPPIPG